MIKINSEIFEQIQAEYFDQNYIQVPDFKYRRKNIKGQRYYIKETDNDVFMSPSVTTVIHNSSPMSHFLVEWYAKNGLEYCNWFLNQSAAYGTFMHTMYNKIILGEKVLLNKEWFRAQITVFCYENDYNEFELIDWYKKQKRDFRKDIYAFIKFIADKELTPIAIEFPVVTKDYAGCIDLVAMDGDDNICMIDYKTGSGIYEDHGIQLSAYKQSWDEQYPERKIDYILNFRPKQFKMSKRTKTFYETKNWTKDYEKLLTKFNIYVELYKLDNSVDMDFAYMDFVDMEIDINTDVDIIIKDYKIKE